MNISTLFFQTAKRTPEAPAVVAENVQLSYREFEAAVRSTAAYFISKGLKSGDRVLVFVPMSMDLYRVVMALFQVGATAVFLDEWVSLERLRICCRLADCVGFIAPWKFRIIGFFVPEIRRIPLHFGLSGRGDSPLETVYDARPDEVALLTFTTGSTGTPKAAARSHGFLKHQFDALIEEIKPQEGDTVMTNLPIVMLVNFGTGARSVIAKFNAKKPATFRPADTQKLIEKLQVNVLIGSPFFMLRLSEAIDNQHNKSVKKIFTGGGPVFPDEALRLSEAFPLAAVHVVYGSTEAEPISTIHADDLLANRDLILVGGLCVGGIYHRISLKIISLNQEVIEPENFAALELPQGEIGEIVVAGEHVLQHYWNNEAAFRQNKIVDINGQIWHRTGDAGFVGSSGSLYLTGRCNQMIHRNGQWISPFIVENLLRQTQGIELGTVLEVNGKLTVIIQLKADSDKKTVEENLSNGMPFAIDSLVFMKKIPRDPRHFSKIDYGTLSALANSK